MAPLKYLARTIAAVLTGSYGVRFSDADCAEEMIFPEEKFAMPDYLDTDGNAHSFFKGYEVTIPPFYVRSVKNGLCCTSFEEAYTRDGQVLLEHTTQKKPPVRWRRFLSNITRIKGKAALLKQYYTENNYYHWLTETLPGLYLIRQSSFKPDYYIIANKLGFQREWLELLDINEEQIIAPGLFIQADELIIPDMTNNCRIIEFRKHFSYHRIWIPKWLIDFYKKAILPRIPRHPKKNIYVSRENAPYRKILNENELLPILGKYEFTVVHSEKLSVKEQIKVFANARAVVGIHGAGLVNAIFSDEGTPVLELNTRYYHDSSFRTLFSQTGQRYHYMIGETSDTSMHPQKENVYIDPKKFEAALRAACI